MLTRWSSASTPGAPSDSLPTAWSGGTPYIDECTRVIDVPPTAVWRVIEGIGGENGRYSLPVARGFLDRLAGGVGLRRGRRDPCRLRGVFVRRGFRVHALGLDEALFVINMALPRLSS